MPTPSTPLARLTSLAASLTAELAHMPDLQSAAETLSREHAQAIAQRLQTDIDRYWAAPSAQGGDRRSMFVAAMQQCLVDEVLLKIEDRQLHSVYSRCLPSNEISDVQPQITFHSLHLSFNDTTSAEISGALVINAGPDITLLSLPGHGVEGFTTQRSMFEALTPLINDRALRNRLLGNAEQCYQDLLEDIDADPDLYFAPFQTSHWSLSPVTEAPFAHAFDRQLHKQRKDIAYAFAEGLERSADEHQWPLMIHRAIHMPDLLGPQAMLGSREITQKEQNLRAGLPDWFRFAPATERQRYLESLQRYEESRSALHSVMGDATSPEHFANVRLRARIGNDLGYDLNPEHLLVSTWRKLPLTRQPYKVTRPLNQLALYGLHSEDLLPGSDFRRWSTLSLQGQPLGSAYPELTNDYLVALIEELELRVGFAPVQRLAYAAPQVRQLMQDVTRRQVKAFAYAAKLQGHIADQDLQLIEAISTQSAGSVEHPTRVQQIKLNSTDALSNLLLFRKDDNLGNVERLVLFMPENPRGRQFIGFNNELQLHEELVSWSFFLTSATTCLTKWLSAAAQNCKSSCIA
ncbi:MAG: dermonecrotic toxin domain-containing protein [Pseudomonas sp.]